MGKLRDGTITKRGLNLIAKSQTGIQIQFTKLAVGDGQWDEDTDFLEATALNEQKQIIDISSLAVLNKDTVRARGALRNIGLETGYFIREIGLFANDPDLGEILYCITTAEIADYFPAYDGKNDNGILIDMNTTVSNSSSVLSILNPDTVMATAADLQELAVRVDILELDKVKRYGVRFSGSTSKGARVEDAKGMVANVATDDEVVINDFDKVSFFNRPICCGYHDSDGKFHINAYRGEPGFAWDGTKGEVYYEETPFYWTGDLHTYVSVSSVSLEGYELSPRFRNGTTKEYSPVFWSCIVGGKPTSRSGGFPGYNSINGHMADAKTYNAKAHTETMAARMSDYILQLVEFATKDFQTFMMGASAMPYAQADNVATVAESGVNRIVVAEAVAERFVVGQTIAIGTTYSNSSIAIDRVVTDIVHYDASNKAIHFDGLPVNIALGNVVATRPWKNGATNIVKASSGSPVDNTSGRYPCIWRGRVDPWGNAFSAICDVLVERVGAGTEASPYTYSPYFLADPTKYASGVITDDYVKLSYKLSQADGYAVTLGLDPRYKHVRLTDKVGGSSTTDLAAWYSYSRYEVGAVFAGGYWNNGRACSPVYFYCNNLPSDSHIYRLSRLFVSRA